MRIIIVGCGKVGTNLAQQLSAEHHNLVIIDEDEAPIQAVSNEVDCLGIVGNGVSHSILKQADIEHADLLIAVTDSDEQNLLCCLIARKTSNCKTIARVRNPLYHSEIEFLKREFELAMIINPEEAAANEISRIFMFPSALKIESFAKELSCSSLFSKRKQAFLFVFFRRNAQEIISGFFDGICHSFLADSFLRKKSRLLLHPRSTDFLRTGNSFSDCFTDMCFAHAAHHA